MLNFLETPNNEGNILRGCHSNITTNEEWSMMFYKEQNGEI